MVLLGLLGLLGVGLAGLVVLLPLPEPMPLELGGVVLLPLELGVLVLPLVAPPLLDEPDLLKCASHSEREICPSLLVSTDEKLGAELLAPLAALPPLDIMPEDPDEPGEPVALGDLLEWEAAMDTPAIAKSAAAVAVPTSFNIWKFLLHKIKGLRLRRRRCKEHAGHETSFRPALMRSATQLQIGAAATLAAAAFVHQRAWQAQRANPPAGKFIEVDGVRLHYIERGDGPPLLMLHGRVLQAIEAVAR